MQHNGADNPEPTPRYVQPHGTLPGRLPQPESTARVGAIELCGTQFWHMPGVAA